MHFNIHTVPLPPSHLLIKKYLKNLKEQLKQDFRIPLSIDYTYTYCSKKTKVRKFDVKGVGGKITERPVMTFSELYRDIPPSPPVDQK